MICWHPSAVKNYAMVYLRLKRMVSNDKVILRLWTVVNPGRFSKAENDCQYCRFGLGFFDDHGETPGLGGR
jgi:Na+-transporting NADH:ubiquinone oxidoreductase subunit NqrC